MNRIKKTRWINVYLWNTSIIYNLRKNEYILICDAIIDVSGWLLQGF